MTYAEVLAHLDALQMHKIKLGLEAMQSFLSKVGRPEKGLRFVHVAGTNGKGSVCAALGEVLGRAGYRVGVYTSPHLSSVRERFRIGHEYISEAAFAELGNRICRVLGREQITYFEFTTALGLLWFAESQVDLVIFETGMGGRLDATNVVTPLVSVITSVSMDHEAYLGNTLAEIAGEKAGIIKTGVPVVSGAVSPEAAQVIEQVSRARHAPLYSLHQEFDYALGPDTTWTWESGDAFGNQTIKHLQSSRASLVQPENDSLAVAVLLLLQKMGFSVSEQNIRTGIAEVKWPGRMEYFEQDVLTTDQEPGIRKGGKKLRYLLDGAHNPDGVRNLANTLSRSFTYRKLIAVWGSMVDKDLPATLGAIAPLVDDLVFTRPDGERAAAPEQLVAFLPEELKGRARCVENNRQALIAAQDVATEDDLILVGGSLYLLGAVRQLLLGDLV
ncbi:MAG: bifunctional folylpolyglutamate synthase/dihydrofolate synthase [Proteobacteria bacterium]|nr:bifunctional folylpolyglutamate synthase/dihydrofolate synthase [Pseudomonadota bacterium]